jgi:hypothetical protein
MGSTGRGIVELTIGGSRPNRVAEVDRYVELAKAAGRPVTMVSVRHNPVRPDEHRQILAKVEAAWREGLRLHPQGTCSPLTSTFTITNGFVFGRYKAWRRVLEAPTSEWRAILADPVFRAEFRDNVGRTALFGGDVVPLRVKRVIKPELQGFTGKSVVEMARETGKDVIDAFLDLALADDFRTEFMSATMNTDAQSVAEIFMHPAAVLGLSDAGAHITQFSEAGQTSQLLGHWVRERRAVLGVGSAPHHVGACGDLRHSRSRPARPWIGGGHHDLRPRHHRLPRGRDRQRHARRRAALCRARQRHPMVLRQRSARHPRRTTSQARCGLGRRACDPRRVRRFIRAS